MSVTNGNAAAARTPVGDYFRLHYTAADVGAAKPAPQLFLAALDALEMKPQQALHVGDHPQLDVQSARDLGMRTVWANRYGLEWPAELRPADGVVKKILVAIEASVAEGQEVAIIET